MNNLDLITHSKAVIPVTLHGNIIFYGGMFPIS